MSVDRSKVQKAAQKHLAKGNYDKAIAEYRKIVEAEPSDIRTWLKIGDLYTRKGARKEAIDTYLRVASQYGDQGFFLKAVAVYKQILKLDPSRLDVQVKLGEMYEMLQLVSDALSTYEHVAAGYARAGNIDAALDILRKMTDLDPENIPVRIKAAEAFSKAGRTEDAAAEFEAGAALLKDQGRIDDYMKVAERLLYHRPGDVSIARELAELYLERQDPKRALAKLQLSFKADPKDIRTLELLGEAFRQLGQLPKTISVLKEVARIHHEAGRAEDRARVLKRILELDPGDPDARQALAAFARTSQSVRRDIQPPASAVVEPSRRAPPPPSEEAPVEYLEEEDELEVLEEADDLMIVEDEDLLEEMEVVEELAPAPPPQAPQPQVAAPQIPAAEPPPERPRTIPPDVQREAQIARLLTECEVFMRYGLKQKVVEQLHAVLVIDPLHVEARERLKDIHLEEGNLEAAITELLTIADILGPTEPEASVHYLRQVLDLSPGQAEAERALRDLGVSAGEVGGPPVGDEEEIFFVEEPLEDVPAGALEQPLEPNELLTLDEGHSASLEAEPVSTSDPDVDFVDAPRTAFAASPFEALEPVEEAPYPAPAEEEPRTAFAASPFDVPDAPSTHFAAGGFESGGATTLHVMPPMHEPAAPPNQHAMVPPPSQTAAVPPPSTSQRLPRPGDPLAPMSPQEFDSVPLRPSTPAAAHAEASQRLSVPPGEVEEILDEADFFIAQGLFDEARASLTDALAIHPGHPLLGDKLREVEGLARQASAAPVELDIDDQSFELAERLAEEFNEVEETQAGSDVLDVEQVFAQFKKGVEQQVGVEDTETHFDLGIAYKEMGLLDDAIAEFGLCVVNPQRTCIAETMIGLCFLEKGEVAESITHFKKGLYADHKGEREELGLYFELGNAYEMLQDPKEALYYFQKVQKRDPDFRDVGTRIAQLAQPQAAAAPAAIASQDDIDRAFDDLLGED